MMQKVAVQLNVKSQPPAEQKPAVLAEYAQEDPMERSRRLAKAAREQHRQEANIQRSSDPNKNKTNKSSSTPTNSYQSSSSERETSGLVRGLVKVIVFSAIVGSVYYCLGSYYGFDRVNKPFEDTYRYAKTNITKIFQ